MFKNKRVIAVITARGGSKGIPNKNLKSFSGKPLIFWTIKAARESKYIDTIVLSTDSPKIASVSKKYGVEAPFLRPEAISRDNSSSIDVLFHALKFFEHRNDNFDIVIQLQPTSPLRRSQDIDKALELLLKKKAKAVISINKAFVSPLWTNILPPNGCMKDFLRPELINRNRQRLPEYFQLNGAVFLGFVEYVVRNNGFYGKHSYAYVMPRERSIDIDDILDFRLAEALLENKASKSCK